MGLRELRRVGSLALAVAFGFFLLSLGRPLYGWAGDLPPPSGVPILTVTGAIAVMNATMANGKGAAVFDRAMLAALPKSTIRTTTPWTEGEQTFEGVLVRDVLRQVGAKGSSVDVAAIDDYRIDIPMEDFNSFDVLLVYAIGGVDLPDNDKGPLWIVYPFSSDPTLNKDIFFARSVWQVDRMVVQ
jgi:hypothetical protein